jgi:hypothetical protein
VVQNVLAQLGLTEPSARTLFFEEVERESRTDRRDRVAVAGHRVFYKLPASARGPAATALFAWAKTYVNSPAFRALYAKVPEGQRPVRSGLG